MKTASLKRLLLINVVALVGAFALLITAAYAWFTAQDTQNADQVIQSGKFEIRLDDNTEGEDEYTAAKRVNIEYGYPESDAIAKARTDNVYKFQVINTGTVTTMFRFGVTVESVKSDDSASDLEKFIRFEVRHATTEGGLSSASWLPATKSLVSDPADALQTYLNSLVVNGNAATALGTLTGTAAETPDTERFFEIRFWIDSTATTAVADSKVTIELTLEAIQAVGGATWGDY